MINSLAFENRLRILLLLFSLSFAFISIRLFHLQVVQGEKLREVAESNRTSFLFKRASRGIILDRNGSVLVDSKPSFVVLFTPLEIKKENFEEEISRLSTILKLNSLELKSHLQRAIDQSSLLRLVDRASRSVAFALSEQRPNLPGISVITEMQRWYPHGSLSSHMLGYLGQVSHEEFSELRSEGYRADWLIGKMGLEKIYDHLLRGQHGGMRIEVDASGHSLKILGQEESIAGYQIKTTLNLKIQEVAEKALSEVGKPGAVIALDPRNGEILAFASSPSFDPNIFLQTRGEQVEGHITPEKLLVQPDLPLFNRAIQGTYPPGSIFKVVAVAAALELKKVGLSESFFCPGYFWLGDVRSGKKFLCWKNKGHGKMTLPQALINSCNVYFYHLGLKLGPDPLERMATQFGLGRPSGLDFPGEKSGFIPKKTMFKDKRRRWFDGDTLNMVIGQGTMLFTPMQAAQMISVVANRGKLYQPRIVDEIRFPTGELYAKSRSKLLSQFSLSQETWNFLNETLTEVVEQGTGQPCKIPGIKVAGKTGTAQNPHGKDHGWFVAYAPVENPTIALSVFVEHGIKGSVSSAPIARKIVLAALSETAPLSEEILTSSPALKETDGD